MSPTISIDEACDLLKCQPDRLMTDLRRGNLPGLKIGREWVIPREAFISRVNEMAVEHAEERRTIRASVASKSRRRPLLRL